MTSLICKYKKLSKINYNKFSRTNVSRALKKIKKEIMLEFAVINLFEVDRLKNSSIILLDNYNNAVEYSFDSILQKLNN